MMAVSLDECGHYDFDFIVMSTCMKSVTVAMNELRMALSDCMQKRKPFCAIYTVPPYTLLICSTHAGSLSVVDTHAVSDELKEDPLTDDGCRFDFLKKQLKHTVAAVMQVNANQMETWVLLLRMCDRVANLNRYLFRYLRSNHDVSVLFDSAHKLRYAAK